MGKDGAGLPLSLKVKNTFIDNCAFQDDSTAHEEDFMHEDAPHRRQFSEPVPFTRAMSGTSQRPTTVRRVEPLEEEEEVGSEDLNDEVQEPE
jgi:hypothetical protein